MRLPQRLKRSSNSPGYCPLLILALLLPVLNIAESEGRSFFVSKSGSDLNRGVAGSPWLTLSRALPELKAGDTLFIFPGVYKEKLWPCSSGQEGAPVCFLRYGKGEVILQPDSIGQETGIFNIKGMGDRGFTSPVDHIYVKGLTFRGSRHFGICIHGGTDGASGTDCVFEDVRCDSNDVGAFFTCRDLVVRNSEFASNRYGGFWIFSGGRNIRVSGCRFHHNGTKGNVDGMTLQDCERVLVEDCEAWGQYDGFDTGSQKDEKSGPGCRYIIFRRCRAFDNYNGNFPSSTTLEGPLCYQYCTAFGNRDWAGGMVMYEAARNTHIWNCTIANVDVGINFYQGPGPVYLHNNIIIADKDAISNEAGGTIVSSGNLLVGKVPAGLGKTDILNVTPRFVNAGLNDFRIAAGNRDLVDRGRFFLRTSGSAKNVTVINVDTDPGIFFFPGDTIQLSKGGRYVIKSMTDSTIELSGKRISYRSGEGIHTIFYGKAPDTGACEYAGR